jgi:hypothetical protein
MYGTSYLVSAKNTVVTLKHLAVESATNNELVVDIIGMGTACID